MKRKKPSTKSRTETVFVLNNDGVVVPLAAAAAENNNEKVGEKFEHGIEVMPLGAAQYVGKSCILLRMEGRLIMLDCGMHLGFTDVRRNPDFAEIGDLNRLSCVIITHFHLDHCAALPVLTEQLGYRGPVFMTAPTRALCKIMLEDYRRIMKDRYGNKNMFTNEMISNCLRRVTCVSFKQRFCIPGDTKLHFTAYHAGHVLGAAMIAITSPSSSVNGANISNRKPLTVVYTGDYNMTPDRHLAPARIPNFLSGTKELKPDILITESTYATSIRDSRLVGENEMLRAIHSCVSQSGKVLIPVFALGRAQELCMLIDDYWERSGLSHVPVYFSSLLAKQATKCSQIFSRWSGITNDHTFNSESKLSSFSMKHVRPWTAPAQDSETQLNIDGPMVLFATSAMLEGGLSLTAFKLWAPCEKNLVLMPGHCVPGTLGSKLTSGVQSVEVKGRFCKTKDKNSSHTNRIPVKCKIKQVINFSAHTDGKGIMDLIRKFSPKLIVLVHGEKRKMETLTKQIKIEMAISACYPRINESIKLLRHGDS